MGLFGNKDKIKKRYAAIEVVGGQNLLSAKPKAAYMMSQTIAPGIVEIEKKQYYYLGLDQKRSHERSAAKTGAGAVIGTVLAPGVGTIIGGAIGAKKKDTSTAILELIDKETDKLFQIEIKCNDKQRATLNEFIVSDYEPKQSNANSSAADELLKLKSLLDQGVLSQEEFDSAKSKLLNS